MKQLKRIAATALTAAALAVTLGAGSASATTLEIEGVTQNQSVDINLGLALGSSAVLSRTDGSLANTCTNSRIRGSTVTYTGATVTTWANTLSFESCERWVTVHFPGKLHIEHIGGTTDGTVSSSGAEVTVGSPFGTLNCKTGFGVDLGRLTGSKWGWAMLDVNAVLNCGFLVPSATWKATYETTWAQGLGVSA
ncbi:MAG: hypothetical protein M3Y75_01380 [Actinomycetota bacterium]|nr:hypothetical protein [Actinomycetota bacterium]